MLIYLARVRRMRMAEPACKILCDSDFIHIRRVGRRVGWRMYRDAARQDAPNIRKDLA
jgi:hypothetical protein